MAVTSALVPSNGSHDRRRYLLGEQRERIIANTTQQQFYQNDHVKQFHRDIILMETLNERKQQIEYNQRIKSAAKEDAKRFAAELKRAQALAIDQERARERHEELKKKAYADELKQQIREMEQRRALKRLERQREVQECAFIRRQNESEESQLRQNRRQDERKALNSYLEHLALKNKKRAMEAKQEAVEEEGRRRFVLEKDQWTKASNDRHAEKFRQRIRCSEALGAKLEKQAREQAQRQDVTANRTLAKALAQQEARFLQERNRRKQMNLDIANSIAGYREYKQKEQQLRAMEEKRSSQDILQASKDADRAYKETEWVEAQRKREERASMEDALNQQVAQKRAQEQLKKQQETEFNTKTSELLALEDLQFQRYTRAIIEAATHANRNTIPLHKTARKGTAQGLRPITGGMRANYLVPGANYAQMIEYVNSPTSDINRLYTTSKDDSTKQRLGFIL